MTRSAWGGREARECLTSDRDRLRCTHIVTPSPRVLRPPVEPEQYTSVRFTEHLAEVGIQPSVGAVGSSYDARSLRRSTVSTRPN